jgi:hypothetical protein
MEQRLLDEMADVGVVRRVEHPVAVATHSHQPSHPQLGQVLRHGRRLGADVGGEIVDRVLAVEEGPQDPKAGVVSQQLERFDRQRYLVRVGIPMYLRNHADKGTAKIASFLAQSRSARTVRTLRRQSTSGRLAPSWP